MTDLYAEETGRMAQDEEPELTHLRPNHTARPRTVVSTNTEGSYDGSHLKPFSGRPGATDSLRMPSRIGNQLHYRDGTAQRIPTEVDLAQQALGTGARE